MNGSDSFKAWQKKKEEKKKSSNSAPSSAKFKIVLAAITSTEDFEALQEQFTALTSRRGK